MALLRQDVVSSSITAKCDNLWGVAWEAVATSHKWSTTMGTVSDTPPTDASLRTLLVYSLAREAAIPVTGRQEDLKTCAALYEERLRRAIVKDLNAEIAALSGDTKTIASEVIKYVCEGDNETLPYSLASITDKFATAKQLSELEVKNAHNWKTTFSQSATTHVAYGAFINATVCRVLASFKIDANTMQLIASNYAKLMSEAISADLEAEMTALRASTNEDDKFAVSVLDVFKQYYSSADATNPNGSVKPQPRGIAALVTHINSVKDNIRHSVLLTHDWSFAKREVDVQSYPRYENGNRRGSCRYETIYPAEAVKIIRCTGQRGNRVEAFLREGDKIVSNEPIERILFMYDDGDTSFWSPLVLKAYIYKVAAAVCLASPELTNNQNRVMVIESAASTALNEAKQVDTRQSFVGTSAYGRNYLLDVATGRCRPKMYGR